MGHARAPFIDRIFHALRGLLLQTSNMSEAVFSGTGAHPHQLASFPADVAGQARVAVDFELRPDGRGRVVHGRLADHVLQILVLRGLRAVVFRGSVAAVLGRFHGLRIFLVRVVLLGAARLLDGLAKLFVGPGRPGVRRFLLPVLPLAGLAAVPRVAAAAPGSGVRDLHQTGGAAREDAGHCLWIGVLFLAAAARGCPVLWP